MGSAVGGSIFEDDYDSEYRYSGRPIRALQGLDRSGVVILRGVFKRGALPARRLGYLVCAAGNGRCICRAESVSTHPPLLELGGFVRLHYRRAFCAPHSGACRVYACRDLGAVGRGSGKTGRAAGNSTVEAAAANRGLVSRRAAGGEGGGTGMRSGIEVVPLRRYARTFTAGGLILGSGGRSTGVANGRGRNWQEMLAEVCRSWHRSFVRTRSRRA